MQKLDELAKLGQSIWYDYIQRRFLASGELKALIDKGVRGVTSNPSIFEKAIAGSTDYDETIRNLDAQSFETTKIYENLALEDIQAAAEQMTPVYDRTNRRDGFVSLEVSPKLAFSTEETVEEAKRLFAAVGKSNLMIKVPGTKAGIPAIRSLIGLGININVTLLFSVQRYQEVARAFIDGLEILAKQGPSVEGGRPVDTIGSVASFFVSRVDAAVDSRIDVAANSRDLANLKGKIAIANAKAAYRSYLAIFTGDRWQRLADLGAVPQRLLWASTGTKNPEYPDTMYVDDLIGFDTVNTVPPATLQSFLDHGAVKATLESGLDAAIRQIEELGRGGIDLGEITDTLEREGVDSFAKAFDDLMHSVDDKRARLRASA